MWYKGLYSKEINVAWQIIIVAYNYEDKFQSYSGVDLKLND